MSRDITTADSGRAARLIGAVLSADADGVSSVLTPLSRTDLYALAIVLAANISEDTVLRLDIDAQDDPDEALCRSLTHAAAAQWQVPVSEVLSASRKRGEVVDARHVAMSAARQSGVTVVEIGRFFGRDHSTVGSALARVAADAKLRAAAARLAWESMGARLEAVPA